jgi:hypothetical protein
MKFKITIGVIAAIVLALVLILSTEGSNDTPQPVQTTPSQSDSFRNLKIPN